MDPRSALKKYNHVYAQVQTEGASPHRLIQVLMESALEKARFAKGAMERRDIPGKIRHINWTLSIVDGLRQSLDMEKGGELARNLDALYDYIQRRLVAANMENQPEILDEVASLLNEIKTAWDAVPEILKKESQSRAAGQINSVVAP